MNRMFILYLYFISVYGDPWAFFECMETEKQKKQYNNRPIVRSSSQIVDTPVITRKTGKSTKHPRRNAGWRGSR